MARFRLFGRPGPAPAGPPGAPAAAPPPPPRGLPPCGPGWGASPPPVGAGAPWPAAGPATRAARPARPGWADDPPTDPHGFPPVPGPLPASSAAGWAGPRPGSPGPDPAEAAALAGAFAVDYLSWDQDDPERRGRVLHEYLPTPGSDPARLGWSGRGRQRAEFALPGLVRPDGDGRLLVDVRVRVTPYRSVGDHDDEVPTAAEPEPGIAGVPAVAPAPTGRGWRSLASFWIRLSVPVTLDGGKLVVDAWEETLGELPAPPDPAVRVPDDHSLADDDPLVEPHVGGAW